MLENKLDKILKKFLITLFMFYVAFDILAFSRYGIDDDIIGFIKFYALVWLVFFIVIFIFSQQRTAKGKLTYLEMIKITPFSFFVMFMTVHSYLLFMTVYCILFVRE